ncbi:hypothetical protein DMUE_2606 [Dictyocoela muelleri]|nr:hypothetical protein DMUE_2606 [Dictyocoela muelleri]
MCVDFFINILFMACSFSRKNSEAEMKNQNDDVFEENYNNINNFKELEINLYLANLIVDLKTVSEIHNDQKNSQNETRATNNQNSLNLKNFIHLFVDKIVRLVCTKTYEYKDQFDCSERHIRFTSFDNLEDLKFFMTNIKDVYVTSSNIMTYEWLSNTLSFSKNDLNRQNYTSQRFFFVSQIIPKTDDINIIWRLYNKIKNSDKIMNKRIVISLTIGDSNGENIRKLDVSSDFGEIIMNFSKNTIIPPICEFDTRGYFFDIIGASFQNYIYGIDFYTFLNNFTLLLNTPILGMRLKSQKKTHVGDLYTLTVINYHKECMYYINFTFKDFNLTEVTLNNEQVNLHNELFNNLFTSLAKLFETPFSYISMSDF